MWHCTTVKHLIPLRNKVSYWLASRRGVLPMHQHFRTDLRYAPAQCRNEKAYRGGIYVETPPSYREHAKLAHASMTVS